MEHTTMTTETGIMLVKAAAIIGGTASGILMVNFLPIKKRYSSMARMLIKMPPNRLGGPRM